MKASEFEAKFEAGEDLTPNLDLSGARRPNRRQTQVFCYVVAASRNPDRVECSVPYRIDDREIFFGPCKKPLREWMRNHYLDEGTICAEPQDDVYVVGFNGGNSSRTRKIIWIGRLTRVMTFSFADKFLNDRRYKQMREWKRSPLHVRPIIDDDRLIGYEHRSELHAENDSWVMDLVKSARSPYVSRSRNRLLLQRDASAWQGFPRDVCLLFENVFFATGRGWDLEDGVVSILQAAQPWHSVDRYAVFGYRADGSVDGKTGNYLHLTGEHAREFANWIRDGQGFSSVRTGRFDPGRAPSGALPAS